VSELTKDEKIASAGLLDDVTD